MAVTLENPRELRGIEILGKGNQIKRIYAQTYRVTSQSGNGSYLVKNDRKEWFCECPDHIHRKTVCKHIYAVYFSLHIRQRVTSENLGLVDTEPSGCKICGSVKIIKIGIRHNKTYNTQRFLCKECGYKFTRNEGFERMKATPKAITIALDLYFKGVSQRKIIHHLRMFEGISVSQPTILSWIRKYTTMMRSYVEKFKPQVGGMWHSDEMTLNIRKIEPFEDGRYDWLWNLMDHDTRFLIASQISERRNVEDARQLFQKAKAATGQLPDFVVTDKLHAYGIAFKNEFYTNTKPRPMHVPLKNIREGTNNNVIERAHGTIRERTKVMRGLDNEKSALDMMEGNRLYYNFLRPHMSLKGKTPAEMAHLDLGLDGNKWKGLIEKAARQHKQLAIFFR